MKRSRVRKLTVVTALTCFFAVSTLAPCLGLAQQNPWPDQGNKPGANSGSGQGNKPGANSANKPGASQGNKPSNVQHVNQGNKPGSGGQHAQPGRNQGPGYGKPAFTNPPAGSHFVKHGNVRYVNHGGHFYKPGPQGYISVIPPFGLIVPSLPVLATSMFVAGMTYFVYDNIYYRQVSSGYEVVAQPTTTTIVTSGSSVSSYGTGSVVSVTANKLNVRSGPGLQHSISGLLYKGASLVVEGTAPDWVYVRLPDGSYGWVMSRYLVVVNASNAEG